MPIPTFTGLPPFPEFNDVVAKFNKLTSEMQNLFLTLDSLNVVSLTADHIDAGTLDAGVVTVRADYNSGAYIQINSSGMTIYDGTQNTFTVDVNGNVTMTGTVTADAGTIGGWVITAAALKDAAGTVGMSSEVTGGDDIRFWAGDTTPSSAPFRVTEAGALTASSGVIGGFSLTSTTLTADSGGTIQNQSASGNKVYMNSTGLHANDSGGVERLTIGTTPAKGAKALIGRDSTGTEQSVYTYDTETVDGASRTGQFITAHGSYILLGNDGYVRSQDVNGRGFRTQASGSPEINDGFGWSKIAKRSESGYSLTTGANTVNLLDRDGNTLSTVTLNINKTTSSHTQPDHNHGIPDGTVLMVDGGGTVTFTASGGFSHDHTVT